MISVRPIEPGDQPWVARRLENAFAGATVARKGVLIDASILPGFVATDGGRLVGLLTYAAASGKCEVVALISTEEGRGIGQGLMDAVRDYAEAAGYRRLWLITTNDNTRAIRFYQGWGMNLCAFYRHGVRCRSHRHHHRGEPLRQHPPWWSTSNEDPRERDRHQDLPQRHRPR